MFSCGQVHEHVLRAGPSGDCQKLEDRPYELPVLGRLASRNCQHEHIGKLIGDLLIPPAEELFIGPPCRIITNILEEINNKIV